jgi:hypothetical protein
VFADLADRVTTVPRLPYGPLEAAVGVVVVLDRVG